MLGYGTRQPMKACGLPCNPMPMRIDNRCFRRPKSTGNAAVAGGVEEEACIHVVTAEGEGPIVHEKAEATRASADNSLS